MTVFAAVIVKSPLRTVRFVPAGTPVLEPSGKPALEVAVAVGLGLELVVDGPVAADVCVAVGVGALELG
jgi:hypothetical protein